MEQGLTTHEAKQLLQVNGKNDVITKKRVSAFGIFLSQFPTVINAVLAVAGTLSFVLQDYLDGTFIFTILLLNGVFGFLQEYRAEKSLEKLKNLITPFTRVIRDGAEKQILTTELVPGDIVVLSEGERIPADGSALVSHHLEVDESLLTGESLPVSKSLHDSLFSGTLVTKGKGKMHIEKTGMQTRFGQIAQSLASIESDQTPLQKRLDHLGKMLSVIAIVFAGLLIPIGILQGKSLFPLMLLAISIGIAAVPEGLPAIVTIALGIGTNRMAKIHAIVRKMPAIETLGAMQVVLIDKTGTLTQNSMRVKEVWLKEKHHLQALIAACFIGNTASLLQKAGPISGWDIVGDKTDGALLLWATSQQKQKPEGSVVDEFVFDPQYKTITTVWKEQKTTYVYVKGAPEVVISKCILKEAERKKVLSQFESYAKQGLRVIALGRKKELHDGLNREHLENNLDFLGLLALYDPPRPEAKHAVEEAKKAGVRTIMVTGDNELTALFIAKEVGLIEQDEEVITGQELTQMSNDDLKKVILKTRIFARSRPEDKLRLVNIFKELGFVVGVTGDGVNDALALKRADVGIAMGESGTDVAKEAADIVLTDDNFSTLVHAIEEGRVIYDNILKSITYLLSGNLAELSLVFTAAILNLPNPLLPTQILWINLVTDGLPALALASDPKNPSLIRQAPRKAHIPILTQHRLLAIAVIGFGLAAILLAVFVFLLQNHSEVFARTVVFNLLIALHLLIAFVVRGGSRLTINKLLIGGIALTYFLQILITTLPPLQKIFGLGLQ